MTRSSRRRGPRCGAAAALVAALASASIAAQAPQAIETFDAAWRIVRDSHFDRTFNGVNWDAVYSELRPRAAAAQDPGELRGVLRDMLGRLGQSHFVVLPATPDGPADEARDSSGNPGFDVRLVGHDFIVTTVEPGGPAGSAGVRAGWKVLAVDGVALSTVLAPLTESLEPRRLQVEAWRVAQTRLRGPAGSRAAIGFETGDGRQVAVSVVRRSDPGQPVTVGHLPTMFVRVDSREARTPGGRTAGIIGFNVWMTAVDAPFSDAVDRYRSADGIVIDLRGNTGGLAGMLMGISGHFIDERTTLGVMATRDNELRFAANPRRVNTKGERVQPFDGPVAILVDALSGSATECFAGGMQSVRRARVFGQPTMGQALPALFDRLPNGDVLIHAYGDFVTADGTRLEGRGVRPDQIVPIDRADLLAGRDRTLDAALAWIDSTGALRTKR